MFYLTYLMGVLIGPLAGKLSNRIGNGWAMVGGAVVFGLALTATLIKSMLVIVLALVGICAGFFTIHAAAAGALNRRVRDGERPTPSTSYFITWVVPWGSPSAAMPSA